MVDTAFDVPAAKHGRVVTVHQRTNGRLVEAPNPASLAVVVRVTAVSTARPPTTRASSSSSSIAGRRRPPAVDRGKSTPMAHNQMGAVRVRLQPTADAALAAVSDRRRPGHLGFRLPDCRGRHVYRARASRAA